MKIWNVIRGMVSVVALLMLAGSLGAQTNIAPTGTGYTWNAMTSATATSNQTAAAGVNDGNLTTGVNCDPTGETANNRYEAAGVIFSSAQSNITKVDFINGTTDSNGNGFFEANLSLQTYNGSAWSNVTGWTVSPTYPYTTVASGVTYAFTGAALNNALGVRVVGEVRVTGQDNSWSWIVNEVRVYTSASADFSLSASPASQTVTAGNNGSYTATVSPLNGFTGAVALSVNGVPSGATASFSPTSISGGTGTSTLSVNTGTAAAGTYNLTVTGKSGSLTHTAAVSLVVTASGTLTNIAPQGTGYTWHTMATATATSNQTASPGVNDNNLTVGVNADVAGESTTNQYEGGGVIFASTQNNITKVDFINGTTDSNGNGFFEANLALQTYNGTAWSNVTGWTASPAYPYTTAASGVTYAFTGGTLNNVLGVRVVGQVRTSAQGNSWSWIVNEVRVYASSSGGAADFSLSASPASQSVTVGGNTSYTATVTALNGFSGAVSLSVSGLPTGATGTFTPASVTGAGTSSLSVTTASTTPAGTYTLTLKGTSGSLSHTATVSLVVTGAPDFTLNVSPSTLTVTAGNASSYSVSVGALNSFNSAVSLSVSGLPTGVTGSFSPTTVTGAGTSTLSITTSASTAAGTYSLTITGTSGSLTHSATVSLAIAAAGTANFTIGLSPTTATVSAGNSATYTATITPTGGFTGTVRLSISGLPAASNGTLTPSSVSTSGTPTLVITTASGLAAGAYNFTVTGVSGSLTHSVSGSLTVNANPAGVISWSGHAWNMTNGGMAGNIPANPSNIFVDANGYLHLRITSSTNSKGVVSWSGSEMTTQDLMGFGTFQWQIQGNNIYNMDPTIVLGPDLYGPAANIGVDGANELDMEFSKWGTADNSINGDFTFYPATGYQSCNSQGCQDSWYYPYFQTPAPASGFTTVRVDWSSTQVIGTLMDGLVPIGTTSNVLQTTTFSGTTAQIPQVAIPSAVNLWNYAVSGNPMPTQNWEVIIRGFQFSAH